MSDILVINEPNIVTIVQESNRVTLVETNQAITVAVGARGPAGEVIPGGNNKEIQFNDAGGINGDQYFRYNKNTRTMVLGLDPTNIPDNPLAVGGDIDSYLQANIQNKSNGADASADYVLTEDNGNDSFGYGDLGISSSEFDSDAFQSTKAHDVYLLGVTDGDLVLDAGGISTSKIRMYAGGLLDTDHILDIDSEGIKMVTGKTITNRPEILSGTSEPPSSVGLLDGTLYFKYS